MEELLVERILSDGPKGCIAKLSVFKDTIGYRYVYHHWKHTPDIIEGGIKDLQTLNQKIIELIAQIELPGLEEEEFKIGAWFVREIEKKLKEIPSPEEPAPEPPTEPIEPLTVDPIKPINEGSLPLKWMFHNGRTEINIKPLSSSKFEVLIKFDGKEVYEQLTYPMRFGDISKDSLQKKLQGKKLGDFALGDNMVTGFFMYLETILPKLKKSGLEKAALVRYTLKKKDYSNEEILQLLLSDNEDEASEALVNRIKEKLYIYTTADDSSPEVWVYEEGIYRPNGKSKIKEELRQTLGIAYNTRLAGLVIDKIQADTFIEPDIFFNSEEKELVVVQNGLLNPNTCEITPHTPDKVHFSKLPVVYDPTKECPFIKQHFAAILKNIEDITIIQEVFGFFLLNEYRYEKAIMMNGAGRNGKGKTIGLAKAFLGPDSFVSVPLQELEEDQYSSEQLMNKRANLSGDLSATALKNTGKFKQLTGRDPISANRKYKSRVQFVNNAKMLFACNELPKTSDLTPAFFDRWILLDFPYTFLPETEFNALSEEEKVNCKIADPQIIDKLTTPEELSGLLNFALEGYARLLKNEGFSWCKSIEDVKLMWVRKSDSFAAFCMDNVEENYDGIVVKGVLQKAYSEYCRIHKARKMNERAIKAYLLDNFGGDEDRSMFGGRQEHVWRGVVLKMPKEDQKGEAVPPVATLATNATQSHKPPLYAYDTFKENGGKTGKGGKLDKIEAIDVSYDSVEDPKLAELKYIRQVDSYLLEMIIEREEEEGKVYEADILAKLSDEKNVPNDVILQRLKFHDDKGDILQVEPRYYMLKNKW